MIYTGNAFPHNFSDAGDDERGWMFLEWGSEPEFFAWPDAPKYKNITLSDLLVDPSKYLLPRTTARIIANAPYKNGTSFDSLTINSAKLFNSGVVTLLPLNSVLFLKKES